MDGTLLPDAATVVCCRTHIDGARAHEVNGDVLIHRVIDGRLIHIQDSLDDDKDRLLKGPAPQGERGPRRAPRQERAEPCGSPCGGSSHFS